MFIIGKASKTEIKGMKKFGWDVEKVDADHFNKALDPKYDPKKNKDKDGEGLVAVFVDNDMFSLLREWRNEEASILEGKRVSELADLRVHQADKVFGEEDLGDEIIVTDSDGWETEGDTLIKRFCYENEKEAEFDKDSQTATFLVTFKKNSDVVKETHVNW